MHHFMLKKGEIIPKQNLRPLLKVELLAGCSWTDFHESSKVLREHLEFANVLCDMWYS